MAGSNPVGRPSVMTEEVIRKLEEAFAFGASDLEACFYADISKTALYEYQKDHPEFAERKEKLKERPILLARQKVVKELTSDVKNAQWYLERKSPDFRPKQNIQVENPQAVLLEAYGVTADGKLIEGEDNDTKTDESVSDTSQDQT